MNYFPSDSILLLFSIVFAGVSMRYAYRSPWIAFRVHLSVHIFYFIIRLQSVGELSFEGAMVILRRRQEMRNYAMNIVGTWMKRQINWNAIIDAIFNHSEAVER